MRFLFALIMALPLGCAMAIMSLCGFAYRRKEEDAELQELADKAMVAEADASDIEHDDKKRWWEWDQTAAERITHAKATFDRLAYEVEPIEPFQVWAQRQRARREAAQGN